MPSWYVWQSLAHWAYSSYDYPETEGGYNLLATILGQMTFSAISSKIVFKSKIFYLLHVVFLSYPPMPHAPNYELEKSKVKDLVL